jgi:UPF0271 protein
MRILLNADIGESYGPWQMGNDELLMPVIDMANIACGGHASDPLTMMKTVKLALDHKVTLGAHPSYPDRLGFGRRPMAMPPSELTSHVIAQVGALKAIAEAEGGKLSYVKPHGALYNTMIKDSEVMHAVMRAVAGFDADLKLMILATARIEDHRLMANDYGLTLIQEAFADRRYCITGELQDRSIPGSVYHEWALIETQVKQLVENSSVTTDRGEPLSIHAESLCVHGDNPESVRVAHAIKSLLQSSPE